MKARTWGLVGLGFGLAWAVGCTPTGDSRLDAPPTPSAEVTLSPTGQDVVPSFSASLAPISAAATRLTIARLKISLPIREGNGAEPIGEGVAWHLDGSAPIGRGSNAFIYSHARAGSFLPLWDARLGDVVMVAFADGQRAEYQVSEVVPLVLATDLRWLRPTVEERLTLQTSTGTAPELPKFLVVARRVR